MAAVQRRARKKRDLEPNLYETNGYYRYRHPQTKKWHGMGNNKQKANAAARKLNAMLIDDTDHVRAVTTANVPTFKTLIDRYKAERLPELKYSDKYLRQLKYRFRHLEEDLGNWLLTDFTVATVAAYLDRRYTRNPYREHRGDLKRIFQWAMTKGLMESNPANETLAQGVTDKKRRPLSKHWYDLIYQEADEWLQVAMDLALITLQREGDLVKMKYSDIRDGYLYIIQSKTRKHGLAARLKMKIGHGLQEVINRSYTIPPDDCPYIIHRVPIKNFRSAEKDHWAQVRGDYLSKLFTKVRDTIPEIASLPSEERPSFHEIRSLGGHLYEQQPNVDRNFVQRLMGHTHEKMTAHYVERHDLWTECEATLAI